MKAPINCCLRGEADLAGLPDFVRAAARQAAAERNVAEADAHVVTLSRSSILPFLTFSARRDLREQAWRAWDQPWRTRRRARQPGAGTRDPRAAQRNWRVPTANLATPDYALQDSMALDQAAVRGLLEQVWERAKPRAQQELAELQALVRASAQEHGEAEAIGELQPWDWRYYAEKLRLARYDLDEAVLKPYFPLDAMVRAAFDCAERLFGLRFVLRPELRGYHPDVQVYEVLGTRGEAGDELIGIFLHDNYARPTKRSGAWMSALRWHRAPPRKARCCRSSSTTTISPAARRASRAC